MHIQAGGITGNRNPQYPTGLWFVSQYDGKHRREMTESKDT
jgi:hypothetical protein